MNRNSKTKSDFSTSSGIFMLKLLAELPFLIIWFLSDMLYIFVYYIIRYRKKVVFKNLKKAFPEKSVADIHAISKRFYRHFCDLTLETIKMSGMSVGNFEKRINMTNPEILNNYFEAGKSVVVLTMHYNNWEWGTFMALQLKHKVLAVYKPLQNLQFDDFMNKTRSRFGMELVPNNKLLRRLVTANKQHDPVIVWLAGDQTPPWYHKSWYTFLHQDALFYDGPAAISKQYNMPVFYQSIEKIGRGKYSITFEPLFDNPTPFSNAEILKKYISHIENIIGEMPEYYLWSHKRWKNKRPKDVPLQ